jgi:glycosyltransferase involved in cell wall biosynthesis
MIEGSDVQRAGVAPVPPGTVRPHWSVMIPTFNCAGHLRRTLASVLAQDPGPDAMQVEVVDDCSTTDDPAAVVAELGRGRVGFFRQPRNLGHVGNFNTCLNRAQGMLVHVLHGDDLVLENFYQRMAVPFTRHPDLGAAFCRHAYIDEAGHWRDIPAPLREHAGTLGDAAALIASHQPIQTPGVVVRREVYERLGGFDARMLHCGEDWEMWVRIAAHYAMWYEPEVLALYRRHTGSLTGRSLRSGQNIRDLRMAIDIYRAYIPSSAADRVARSAREHTARWAISLATDMMYAGDNEGALRQVREALRTSLAPPVVRRLARMAWRFAWLRARGPMNVDGSGG